MVKIIKVDGKNHYFVDDSSDPVEKKRRFEPELSFVTKLDDGSVLNVKPDKIVHQHGGQVYFHYCGDKYIIDDGFQDILIRAGYFVLGEYDHTHLHDKEEGTKLRKQVFSDVKNVCYSTDIYAKYQDVDAYCPSSLEMVVKFERSAFFFTITITSVNNVVNKNQTRKMNGLPFYPFDKTVDRYGSMFISVFCERLNLEADETKKYEIADEFVNWFCAKLNQVDEERDNYHYVPLFIKRRLINCKDM